MLQRQDDYCGKDADGDSAAVFAFNHADHWGSLSSDISLARQPQGSKVQGDDRDWLRAPVLAVRARSSRCHGAGSIISCVRCSIGDDDDGAWTASACEDDDVDCEQSYQWTRTPCQDVGAAHR